MRILTVAASLIGSLLLFSGCSGETGVKASPRVDVAGTVEVDGKLLEEQEAEISFIPGGGNAPSMIPIKGGKFEGKAPVGDKIRVEIRAMKQGEPVLMDGKPVEGSGKINIIAPEFNTQSTLTANIPAGGDKNLKFEVKKSE